jgi:A/G-specific adenine glycosylase
MPWKGEKDAYRIWLSEIILQQTRVEQGLDYYNKFIKTYPTVVDLANANDEQVFKLWEGLGYYSRCKNLLYTARVIADKYNGIFPSNYDDIIALKGIGSYTAAAITSFAYNLPYAVLDGNVYRVLSRVFAIDLPIDSKQGKDYFTQLSQELLDKKKPALYNQAIMDLGAMVCKPKLALCDACCLQKMCKAYKNNLIDRLPVKEKKLLVTTRYFYYFIIQYKNKILITKRTDNDIWQSLFQFYLAETQQEQQLDTNAVKSMLKEKLNLSNGYSIESISKNYQQKLTHRTIKGNFIYINIDQQIEVENYFWINKKGMNQYSFPKFINQFLETNEL